MEQFDHDKFKAMIHYIADSVPRSMLGKVKLNKILWFSDREMYLQTGNTISGETYLKFPQGAVSKNILPICDELVAEGKIAVRKPRYQYDQYEYISLAQPDILPFSAQETDVIYRVIQWIAPMSAAEASEVSHGRAWDTAEFGNAIPMFSVLAEKARDLTPEDLVWALAES